MAKVNNFDVLKKMGELNGKIQMAPLGNIIHVKKVRAGTEITIGVAGDLVTAVFAGDFVGGLVLADKKEFDKLKAEMEAA